MGVFNLIKLPTIFILGKIFNLNTCDTFLRGEILPCVLISGPQVQHKQQSNGLLYICIYLQYSGVLFMLRSALILGCTCILYTTIMPIGTCSLMLTLEGGWLQPTSKYSYHPSLPWGKVCRVELRWWTSAMIFSMLSSMPLAVALFLPLGSAYRFFCFNLDMASATTFSLSAMCLNTILYSFNSSAHLFKVGFFMFPKKNGTRGLWWQCR